MMISPPKNAVLSTKESAKKAIICLALAVVTLAVFWQISNHDFVNIDDDIYITKNPHVKAGLTREGVCWAFTTIRSGHWHPVTWLSYMLDVQLFGLNSKGYHIVSIFLHIANTLLLFLLFNQMTSAVFKSGFVAALFALHPLHVEAVAWVADRKDLLSTFFLLLALMAYVRYSEQPGIKRYMLVLFAFILGLMSKPTIMTLPFVLLVLDYWPLGRIQSPSLGREKDLQAYHLCRFNPQKYSVLNLLLEKIPLFIFVVASAIVATMALKTGKSVPSDKIVPIDNPIANALVSYTRYLAKTIWPHNLVIPYGPLNHIPIWQAVGAGLLLGCIFYFAIRSAQHHPYFVFGWLWYLITLAPVIGLTKAGPATSADRYTYVPLIGLFVLVSWGVPDLLEKWRYRKIFLAFSSGILVSVLMICTWMQLGHWRNSITLFQHTLRVNPHNSLAHNNVGTALFQQGQINTAIDHFKEAVKLSPGVTKHQYNLGLSYLTKGEIDSALARLEKALFLTPNFPEGINALGLCYASKGMIDHATSLFEKALSLDPDYADALNNLGKCYYIKGKFDLAVIQYRKALEIVPNDSTISKNLTEALSIKSIFP